MGSNGGDGATSGWTQETEAEPEDFLGQPVCKYKILRRRRAYVNFRGRGMSNPSPLVLPVARHIWWDVVNKRFIYIKDC